MTTDDFLSKIQDVLMSDDILTPGTRLQRLPGWGPEAIETLAGMIDVELGVPVTKEAIRKCLTVGELLKLVAEEVTD